MRTHVQVVLAAVLALSHGSVNAADVPYVMGGVGADERQELLAKEKEHNLKVVVAEVGGDFLSDVTLVIESAKKESVLSAKMEGPILLAKLPPGTYTVRATSDDKTMTKSVTVTAQGLRTVDFRWPRSSKESD